MAGSEFDGQLAKLGFKNGQVVVELGLVDGVDEELRMAVEDFVDADMETEDYQGTADVVLIWWAEGDPDLSGDLTDMCVDAVSVLEPSGFIVLLTPKVGLSGQVDATDIAEAARTAGLNASASTNLTSEWSATRLVSPKIGGKR